MVLVFCDKGTFRTIEHLFGFDVHLKLVRKNMLKNMFTSLLMILGTIHLRRQYGWEGCPHLPMVKRSQYIRIKNPLHKHFAGMPMVGVKNRENLPTS